VLLLVAIFSTATVTPSLGLPSQNASLYRPHQHPAALCVQNCANSTNLHLKLTIIINDGRSRTNNYKPTPASFLSDLLETGKEIRVSLLLVRPGKVHESTSHKSWSFSSKLFPINFSQSNHHSTRYSLSYVLKAPIYNK
jgi:hypothetical protein